MTMHCNVETSSWTLCRIQSNGVVGLEASPCAASTLLRVPIDGPRVSQRTTLQTSHWRKATLRFPHVAYPQHGTSSIPDR